MGNTIFNRSEIYSQENATILEELLDRKTVPFIEFMKIFFPDRVAKIDIDSYLMDLIQPGVIRDLINQIPSNILLCFFTPEYFYLWFVQRWLMWRRYCLVNIGEPQPEVYVNPLLSLLIDVSDLPAEIRRLPRLANKDVVPAYYDDIFDYNSATTEEIIFHEANYCSSEPVTLTYFEAIKLITQHGYPETLLKNSSKKEAIAVFLEVPKEHVRNNQQLRQLSNLTLLREENCGNASYKKRFKGLERLNKETIDNLFQGKTISIKAISIAEVTDTGNKNKVLETRDKDGTHTYGTYTARSLEVQSTDIETKFHLKCRIVSCVQRMPDGSFKISNQFELKDTHYLQEDIEALIFEQKGCSPTASNENKTDTAQESLPQSKQKRTRSEQHPFFMVYATNYSKAGTFGDYSKMMIVEKYVFKTKREYLTMANNDNTDNTDDHIKHVAFVHGTTKCGNPKYDIYYKPVLNDRKSLGKAKIISARCAETYFNHQKRKSHVNNT